MADEFALGAAVAGAKLRHCDHCRRVGRLIGHGRLLGYSESSSDRVVRGHRLFCSDRGRRDGCGHTIAVLLACVLPRRIVRAATIFAFLAARVDGATAAAAWRRSSSMTLRTGYRIREALALVGPAVRAALLSRAPPPSVASPSPDARRSRIATSTSSLVKSVFRNVPVILTVPS